MHLLLIGTFGIKFISVLLFMLGLCEVLIRIQQMSLNDYNISDLSPFYFSGSSIISGAGGIMIVDNSFIHFLNFASVITVLTSVVSSRLAYGQYAQLNRLRACSTYEKNVTGELCLADYDNSSSILSEPVNIRSSQVVLPYEPTHLLVPEVVIIPENTPTYEWDDSKEDNGNEVSPTIMFEPTYRLLTNATFNNSSNSSFIVSDFMNDVECYGDSDYFLSAYYCEFYQIAKNKQKEDICYCVTDATMDDHTTCFEYKSVPFCGDLLEQLPILTWSTYLIATLCWILAFLLSCLLCLIGNRTHGEISLSVLFYFKEYSERVVPHKVAVAEYTGNDVVMADVVTVGPDEEVEMTETRGAAAVEKGASLEEGRDLLLGDPPPINDDLVREFDALAPTVQSSALTSPSRPQQYNSVPTSENNDRALRSPVLHSGHNSASVSPAGLIVASPVAPVRNFLRFSSRVAPDADLDVAPIEPTQAYEL